METNSQIYGRADVVIDSDENIHIPYLLFDILAFINNNRCLETSNFSNLVAVWH